MRAWALAGILFVAACSSAAKPPPTTLTGMSWVDPAKAAAAADAWILYFEIPTTDPERFCLHQLYAALTPAQFADEIEKTTWTQAARDKWKHDVQYCYLDN